MGSFTSTIQAETTKPEPSLTKKLPDYDFLLKILLLGEPGAGKTSLLERYSYGVFYESCRMSTIGVDFKIRTIEIDELKIKLQIWDPFYHYINGLPRYSKINASHYRNVQGIIIVYDITNQETFDNVEQWYKEIDLQTTGRIHKVLVGTKCDLEKDRKIRYEDGQALAESLKIDFRETSAKTGENIEELFSELSVTILKNQTV